MKIARLLIYIIIILRLTWQESAQLEVISHARSREGTGSGRFSVERVHLRWLILQRQNKSSVNRLIGLSFHSKTN